MNTIGSFDSLAGDVRHALRMMRHSPGFAATVAATLAFGIGATTSIFSVVNGVLIRPLPFPQPDSLIKILHSARFQNFTSNGISLSSTMYLTYRDHNHTFEGFGLWRDGSGNVTGRGEPEEVRTLVVTFGTLPALGILPALGRWFTKADDTAGTPETVILTYGYWQRQFGGDRAVLGRTLTIDGRGHEIIGIMPRTFRFLNSEPEVILPQRFTGPQLQPNDVHAYNAVARLRPGVTMTQAREDVARMLPIWIDQYGTSRSTLEAAHFAPALRPLKQDVTGDIGRVLWVLMGTAGTLLAIACANAANLLLARAYGRRQEAAIRAALGAGWARIVREFLVESLLLGLCAGVLGLAVAYGGVQVLVAQGPASLPRLHEITMDSTVMAFAFGVSLLSGLLLGIVPAVQYARFRNASGVPTGGRTMSQSRAQHRSQDVLVVIQVALALVLLVGSALMIRSFLALRRVQPGFTRPEMVQTVRISIPESQADQPERAAQMEEDIVSRIAAIPGVDSAAYASDLPMEPEFENNVPLTAEDKTYDQSIPPLRRSKSVSPGYFGTLGIPLVAGRDFTWADLQQERAAAIVSENLARELWGTPSAALGKRVSMGRMRAWKDVIGVAGDVHDGGVQLQPPATVYWRGGVVRYAAVPAYALRDVTIAVRSRRTGTESLLTEIREGVHAVNPNLPLARVRTLAEDYERSMARTSFTLVLLAVAGAMALLLGIVGIYGVLAYAVAQRRREAGIRLALGAPPKAVLLLFVRHGMLLGSIGIGVGLATAAGLSRLMTSLLFGVTPLDAIAYGATASVLLMSAFLASYFPGRRAASVDPGDILRAE